jgi:hypothetical protein
MRAYLDARTAPSVEARFTYLGPTVDLVQVNVPAHDHRGVTDGWKKYYWDPSRAYLGKRPGR